MPSRKRQKRRFNGMSMLHHWFAHPWALFLPSILPALGILAWLAQRRRQRALARIGTLMTLQALLARPSLLARLRNLCASLGLLTLIVGIAGPQWDRDPNQVVVQGRDLVVVLDLSRSMLAETPSRLERARAGIVSMSHDMQKHGGHRIALVVFAGRSRVVCPLTRDYDHFRDALETITDIVPPPDLGPGDDDVSGTRIGRGLRTAVQLHDPEYQGHQDILLVSDGDDPVDDDEWRTPAEEAREMRIVIHTAGVGTLDAASKIPYRDGTQMYADREVETRPNEKPLAEIARITQGTYLPPTGREPMLAELFEQKIEPGPKRDDTSDAVPVYRQQYAWFLAPALALLALSIACPERFRGGNRR